MNMKLTNGLLGLGAMLIASQVSAATVSLTPASNIVSLGDSFTLDIGGTNFADGATGGSVAVTWDASILQLDAVSLASGLQSDGTGTGGTYEWDSFGADPIANGFELAAFFTNTDIFGNPFPVTGATFDFLLITFTVIAAPLVNPSDVTIFAASVAQGPWQDGLGNDIFPTYNSATVTVNAIPVPAAAWLFGSGLIGMVAVARRRKTQLA